MRFYCAVASVRRMLRMCSAHTQVTKKSQTRDGVKRTIEERRDIEPDPAFLARLGIPTGQDFMTLAFPDAADKTVRLRTIPRGSSALVVCEAHSCRMAAVWMPYGS